MDKLVVELVKFGNCHLTPLCYNYKNKSKVALMSPTPSKVDIIQAILTNQSLTDNEKTLLIDEFINEIKKEYPDLKYHATNSDLTELQLQLTKEIKELDLKISKEMKEMDSKLFKEISESRKEMKKIDLKSSKEIAELRKEMKEMDVRLTKEISNSKSETIKWVAGMLFVQVLAITGVFFGAFKLFLHS